MSGKESKRLREWSLLGDLLGGIPLVSALAFMDRAFTCELVPWRKILHDVSCGSSLSEAIVDQCGKEAPPGLLEAVRRGEADGNLRGCLGMLDETEDGAPFETEEDAPAVVLVNELIRKSMAKRYDQFRLRPDQASVVIEGGRRSSWHLIQTVPQDLGQKAMRRLLVMVGLPYWMGAPARSFSMIFPEGKLDAKVDRIGDEVVVTLSVQKPK